VKTNAGKAKSKTNRVEHADGLAGQIAALPCHPANQEDEELDGHFQEDGPGHDARDSRALPTGKSKTTRTAAEVS